MIRIKIDVSKLDKTAFFKGAKGTYADITLLENKGGPDKFGNDYMVVQDLGKERRLNGERGPILGNGKAYVHGQQGSTGGRPQQASQSMYEDEGPRHQPKAQDNAATDDVPF